MQESYELRYMRKMAKLYDFYKELKELDKILTGTEERLIKKTLYKYLLVFKLEDEQVKETMIAWAENFGYTTELDKWQELWDRNYKLTMSTAYKENLYTMFYRWHLALARLAKMFKDKSAKFTYSFIIY